MSQTVRIRIKKQNQSEPEWVFANWDFCTRYARGEYDFISDINNVMPPENFGDVVAFTSEIDRLRGHHPPTQYHLRKAIFDTIAAEVKDILYARFLGNGNKAEQVTALKNLVLEKHPDWQDKDVPRRIRELAQQQWLERSHWGSYKMPKDAFDEMKRKQEITA